MKWYFADTMTTFAILEFKDTKVLNRKGFEAAACDNEDDAGESLSNARGETLLEGNAIVVSKQAKKLCGYLQGRCNFSLELHDGLRLQ